MCLSITIILSSQDHINPDEINALLPADAKVECRLQLNQKSSRDTILSISEIGQGCACSLLSDEADWNSDYWDFRPEFLGGIAQLIRLLREHTSTGFVFQALWAGESPPEKMMIRMDEFEIIVARNKLATKTKYVIL